MTIVPLPLAALPCRICGQPAPYRLAAKGDRSGESITVYFCRACNVHYTNPPDFDYETQDEGLISYYEAHRDYILWRHNLIFDYLERTFCQARGRFLDIGSGAGYSLEGYKAGMACAGYRTRWHVGEVFAGSARRECHPWILHARNAHEYAGGQPAGLRLSADR